MTVFKAESWFEIWGLGRIALVALDRETSDFSHLIGHEVTVDGAVYTCRGVERFAHCPPWHEGETVGLLVEG